MPRTGDTIAERYQLERPLAEGGMGSVWLAKHLTLGRPFAIKFLKKGSSGEEHLEERFLREARLAASIRHRFVVDTVDFGIDGTGLPYMVMEYLEGETLYRRLRRPPPLPVRELVRLFAEVLLGLEAVHRAGVVHRDMKPENIMLVNQADGTRPKLVDFGISKANLDTSDGERLTIPGAFMGTPWYMAPEQTRGEEADPRADIYAVGVILYETLIGRAPFERENLFGLLEAIREGGAAPIHVLRPELGEELSAVIARAMAAETSARFQSAEAFSLELSAVLPGLAKELACSARACVSRTDTEIISHSPSAVGTGLLSSTMTPELTLLGASAAPVQRAWPRRAKRAVALTGGAALLLVLAALAPTEKSAPAKSATVVRAATPLPMLVVPAASPSAGSPAPEARPATSRRSAHSARARQRRFAEQQMTNMRMAPDLFRSPGF